ncbi:hypothetical protein J8273_5355 [Carpediemonas membranifera]|uniref:WDHD1/CFT4 second beta-propeller domain-containing protein n=1 Tax=Carpediemonas membranifera TaxID=201153 RepID=A0A8J6E8T3_9EUKA|nr:hypothetical protein J8273_5355 [Carpediemonas membranifera]|eukprot:KAG9392365.1 hypothetical protein J8273_5355 [Carpediemonas membranifera]
MAERQITTFKAGVSGWKSVNYHGLDNSLAIIGSDGLFSTATLSGEAVKVRAEDKSDTDFGMALDMATYRSTSALVTYIIASISAKGEGSLWLFDESPTISPSPAKIDFYRNDMVPCSVAFDLNGQDVAVGLLDGRVLRFSLPDLRSAAKNHSKATPKKEFAAPAGSGPVLQVEFSDYNAHLAAFDSVRGEIRIYRQKGEEQVYTVADVTTDRITADDLKHAEDMKSVARSRRTFSFNHAGDRLVAPHMDGESIILVDMRKLKGDDGPNPSAAVRHNLGDIIEGASHYRANSGKTRTVTHAVFTPRGNSVAVVYTLDRTCVVTTWDLSPLFVGDEDLVTESMLLYGNDREGVVDLIADTVAIDPRADRLALADSQAATGAIFANLFGEQAKAWTRAAPETVDMAEVLEAEGRAQAMKGLSKEKKKAGGVERNAIALPEVRSREKSRLGIEDEEEAVQLPFQPGSTPYGESGDNILTWTGCGKVSSQLRVENSVATSFTIRAEHTKRVQPAFTVHRMYQMAALSDDALMLAATADEENGGSAEILLRRFLADGGHEETVVSTTDDIIAVAVGKSCAAVALVTNDLCLLTLDGLHALDVISLPGKPVTVSALNDLFAVTCQVGWATEESRPNLATLLVDSASRDPVLLQVDTPVSPASRLFWTGLSAFGQLVTVDSRGIARMLTTTRCPAWRTVHVPAKDTSHYVWPIAVRVTIGRTAEQKQIGTRGGRPIKASAADGGVTISLRGIDLPKPGMHPDGLAEHLHVANYPLLAPLGVVQGQGSGDRQVAAAVRDLQRCRLMATHMERVGQRDEVEKVNDLHDAAVMRLTRMFARVGSFDRARIVASTMLTAQGAQYANQAIRDAKDDGQEMSAHQRYNLNELIRLFKTVFGQDTNEQGEVELRYTSRLDAPPRDAEPTAHPLSSALATRQLDAYQLITEAVGELQSGLQETIVGAVRAHVDVAMEDAIAQGDVKQAPVEKKAETKGAVGRRHMVAEDLDEDATEVDEETEVDEPETPVVKQVKATPARGKEKTPVPKGRNPFTLAAKRKAAATRGEKR